MKNTIIQDCVKSSKISSDFTHISNGEKKTFNSTKSCTTADSNCVKSSKISSDLTHDSHDSHDSLDPNDNKKTFNSTKLCTCADDSTILLKQLNLTKLSTHKMNVLIIGKREDGKTQLIKDFIIKMKNNNLVDSFVIFTTEYQKKAYEDLCVSTDKIITQQFNENIIENLINYQEKNPTNKLMIIFDDLYMENKMISSNSFSDLMLNGRHYNIGTIMANQFPHRYNPEVRNNIDIVMIYKDEFVANQKRSYEYYFGTIPKFKYFCQIIGCLNKYECLVYDGLGSEKSFSDVVKYYISDYVPPNKNNKIQLLDIDIFVNKENKENHQDRTKELLKILKANSAKIHTLVKENEKIMKELANDKN